MPPPVFSPPLILHYLQELSFPPKSTLNQLSGLIDQPQPVRAWRTGCGRVVLGQLHIASEAAECAPRVDPAGRGEELILQGPKGERQGLCGYNRDWGGRYGEK